MTSDELYEAGRAARRDGLPFNSWPLSLGILEVLEWWEGWRHEDALFEAGNDGDIVGA